MGLPGHAFHAKTTVWKIRFINRLTNASRTTRMKFARLTASLSLCETFGQYRHGQFKPVAFTIRDSTIAVLLTDTGAIIMTLQDLAYLADIIAAIAVIASLIYVARELRHNTRAMLVANADHFVDFNFHLNTPFATNREFAEIWVKGESDFDSLDVVDRQRLVIWEFQAIAAWSNFFNLRQQGLISNEQWAELVGTFTGFGRRQSVREAWKTFKNGYTPAFRDFMSQYMESDPHETVGNG